MSTEIIPVNTSTLGLIHFDRARKELELATNIDEVKQIRDQAEAIRIYIKQQKGSADMQNQAAEIKLRAERRAGEMLKEREMNTGTKGQLIGRGIIGSSIMEPPIDIPKLSDLGINKAQSYRWQLESELPEDKFEELITKTKQTQDELTSKAILRAAQQLKREEERSEQAGTLPDGVFNVIYADPPWKYDNQIVNWGPTKLHYNTLSIDEIAYYSDSQGIHIQDKFAPDAVLFLWVTNPFLRDSFEIIDAWGFEYKTNIVWVKTELQRPGSGFYVRGRHELLFICTKGSFVPNQKGKEPIGSVIEYPAREHSRKPDETYHLIETMYPECKYLELFARERHEGWAGWGNQLNNE